MRDKVFSRVFGAFLPDFLRNYVPPNHPTRHHTGPRSS